MRALSRRTMAPTVRAVLARAVTFALVGVDAMKVTVEADIHPGLPSFTIVGLPDAAVQESRERVRAALVNSGFEFPLRRITVNLAPADMRKAGPGFDLALAAAVLVASGQLAGDALGGYALGGELGLDGSVRPMRGALAMADACRRAGLGGLVVPAACAAEASLLGGLDVVGVGTLRALAAFLAEGERPPHDEVDAAALLAGAADEALDLGQVRGHHALKRALEIAAAGGHNLLMVGPPGSGKSMAARRLSTIMPPLSVTEALEVTRVHSAAGLLGTSPLVTRRPFRAPHHTVSSAGLVGGGPVPSPGEATLAQHGVLFLDELAEFARPALEALRQPVEEGSIRITRSQRSVTFPARFMLVAATNPCPCGYLGDERRQCSCPEASLRRYRSRLSGPLLDRIDMIVRVASPSRDELMAGPGAPESAAVRARVTAARARQSARHADTGARCNAELGPSQLRLQCRLEPAARAALYAAHDRLRLSVRGHDRALRVARTLADLEGRDTITRADVAQAVAYREHHASELLGSVV
jgi:magnesium chelatase family protein